MEVVDVSADDGSTGRYCLEGWIQTGQSAAYTFLYRIEPRRRRAQCQSAVPLPAAVLEP
jgi:hypothetical protein